MERYGTVKLGKFVLTLFDKEPVEVKNPYSGESCMLTPEAVALYDFIKGCETLNEDISEPIAEFIMRWPEEYMILLD